MLEMPEWGRQGSGETAGVHTVPPGCHACFLCTRCAPEAAGTARPRPSLAGFVHGGRGSELGRQQAGEAAVTQSWRLTYRWAGGRASEEVPARTAESRGFGTPGTTWHGPGLSRGALPNPLLCTQTPLPVSPGPWGTLRMALRRMARGVRHPFKWGTVGTAAPDTPEGRLRVTRTPNPKGHQGRNPLSKDGAGFGVCRRQEEP